MKLKIIIVIIVSLCLLMLFRFSSGNDHISFFFLYGLSAVILWLYNFFYSYTKEPILSDFYDKFMYYTGIVMLLELWILYTGGAESPFVIFFYFPIVWIVLISKTLWQEELFFLTFLVFIFSLNFNNIVVMHFTKHLISLCLFYMTLKFLLQIGIFRNDKK